MDSLQKLLLMADRAPHQAIDWIVRQVNRVPANLAPKFIQFLTMARRHLVTLKAVIDWAIIKVCDRLSYAVTHTSRPY